MKDGRVVRSEGRGVEAAGVEGSAKRDLLKEIREDRGEVVAIAPSLVASLSRGGIFL